MRIGIDIGSTTIKCVVLDDEGNLLHKSYERHFAMIKEKTRAVIKELIEKFNITEPVVCAVSGSAGMGLAERAGVPLQDYHNRADIPGGSTLGTIADVLVPIPTADIGLPQLAMHSSVECAALEDINSLVTLCRALFSSEITARADALSLSVKL